MIAALGWNNAAVVIFLCEFICLFSKPASREKIEQFLSVAFIMSEYVCTCVLSFSLLFGTFWQLILCLLVIPRKLKLVPTILFRGGRPVVGSTSSSIVLFRSNNFLQVFNISFRIAPFFNPYINGCHIPADFAHANGNNVTSGGSFVSIPTVPKPAIMA